MQGIELRVFASPAKTNAIEIENLGSLWCRSGSENLDKADEGSPSFKSGNPRFTGGIILTGVAKSMALIAHIKWNI
jgi:hypothetical protein